MTPFPLPIPTTVAEPQPAQDLGGVVVTFRCAPELADYAIPVIDGLRQHHRTKGVEHGLSTPFGFSRWLLRQDGEARYAITSPGHTGGEGTGEITDDLTVALWVQASRADAVHRAAVHRHHVDFSGAVSFTPAALTAVEGGGPRELVLHRRRPAADGDSGWVVRPADPATGDDEGEDVQVTAGRLVDIAPNLVPYLALPVGTVVRVAEGRFLGAWWTASKDGTITAADHQLLDEEGHGPRRASRRRRRARAHDGGARERRCHAASARPPGPRRARGSGAPGLRRRRVAARGGVTPGVELCDLLTRGGR